MKHNNIIINRYGLSQNSFSKKANKKPSFLSIILSIAALLIILMFFAMVAEIYIGKNISAGQENTWISSVASYWGGIIGGMISGIMAFCGVFCTIKYYKESDAIKERASVQPFLFVDIAHYNDVSSGFTLGQYDIVKEKQEKINLKIMNIGNGFARTIVIHTGYNIGGLEYSRVINVNDKDYIYLVVSKDNNSEPKEFALQYIDSKCNEYIQEYSILKKRNTYEIENGYPNLIT